MEKIVLTPQGEDEIALYVLEQTRLGGVNYLLTTDVEDGDGDAYILKEVSDQGEENAYEFVENDEELNAVATVFSNLMEDIELVQ